jgi:hypothetical protein
VVKYAVASDESVDEVCTKVRRLKKAQLKKVPEKAQTPSGNSAASNT